MVWTCTFCTVINDQDEFVACATCGNPRAPEKRPAPGGDDPSPKRARGAVIDLCASSDDDDEVVSARASGGGGGADADRALARRLQAEEAAAAAAAEDADATYAWRPLFCSALGRASPGNVGAVGLGDLVGGAPRWVVVSNFMISARWLSGAWPELARVPRVAIFHGCAATARGLGAAFPNAEVHDMTPKRLTFTHPRTGNAFRNEYGCHHSKFFLVGYETSVRVVVHTANLISRDFAVNTQGVWTQDFPVKGAGDRGPSDFEDGLAAYLETLDAHAPTVWPTRGLGAAFQDGAALSLPEAIRRFDFGRARGRLVASAPGYHVDADRDAWGLARVAAVLRADAPPGDAGDELLGQFSSFSAPQAKLLRALETAFGAGAAAPAAPLRLVWPSGDEVRSSIEGYAAGSHMPSRDANVDAAPRDRLRRWAGTASRDPYVAARVAVMPHIKTWTRVAADGVAVRWSLLGSANLSRAAWGELQKKDTQLFVASWELGVLTTPASIGSDLATTAGRPSAAAVVPLPFACPPAPYAPGDAPFSSTRTFAAPDRRGKRGTLEYR